MTDAATINPQNETAAKSKEGWALDLASRGIGIHPLVFTLPDGSCSCGSKPNEKGDLISPNGRPCKPGKHPASARGVHDATTDAATIKAWFKKEPRMNYGVAGGNGLTIIDLDKKNGKDGIRAMLNHLDVSKSTLVKQTFTVETPTGGLHNYFNTDEAYGNRAGILSGVDVRSAGGYVVGPGSIVHMKDEFGGFYPAEYKVINDAPLCKMPESIAALLTLSKERAENAGESMYPDDIDSDRARYAARKALERFPVAVEGEGGNDQTYAAACHVRDFNVSKEVCFDLMTESCGWNERCKPEWDHNELVGLIDHGYHYAKGQMGNRYEPLPDLMKMFGLKGDYSKDSELPPDFDKPNDNQDSNSAGNAQEDKEAKDAFAHELEEITNATGSSNEQGKWVPYTDTEITFGELLKREKPPVDFIVDGLIEKYELCLFQGAGGAGKGRALAQLCACFSFDLPFVGHQIAKGQEWVFIGNEDDWKEMGRRFDRMLPGLRSLARQHDIELDTEGNLRGRFIDRTGLRTSLVRIAEDSTTVLPGAVLFRRYLKSIPGHKIVILDSAYDFADWVKTAKVSETMVNWYCKVFLKYLEKDTDSTFILIAHPSQAGEDRKDESGWSVAWRNAIRSRIGFRKKRRKASGKAQGAIIPGEFTMAVHKLSHGPDGHEVPLYENEGIFIAGVREPEFGAALRLSTAFYLYAVEQARKGEPVLAGRNPDKAMCRAIAMVGLPGETEEAPVTLGYTPLTADVKALIDSRCDGKLKRVEGGGKHKAGLYPVEVADKWSRELKAGKPLTPFNPSVTEHNDGGEDE